MKKLFSKTMPIRLPIGCFCLFIIRYFFFYYFCMVFGLKKTDSVLYWSRTTKKRE